MRRYAVHCEVCCDACVRTCLSCLLLLPSSLLAGVFVCGLHLWVAHDVQELNDVDTASKVLQHLDLALDLLLLHRL